MLDYYKIILAVIFLTCISICSGTDNCNVWAQYGECNTNPVFMWDFCTRECLSKAKNSDKKCATWAKEGKCAKDADVIAKCPKSCQFNLAWNPWTRKAAGIDYIHLSSVNDSICTNSNFLFGSAEVMRERLLIFLSGSIVKGLSIKADDELMGMIGLSEAVIYTAKLYDLVLKKSKGMYDAEKLISDVNTVLSQYNGDLIMRKLRVWVDQLHDISESIYTLAKKERDHTCLAYGPAIKELLALVHPSPRLLMKVKYDNYPAATTLLSNGVSMPTMGMGTWQLNGQKCYNAVETALQLGYRHFDTAEAYYNEEDIGKVFTKAIKSGTVTRKDLFITSKMSSINDYNMAIKLVKDQLRKLRTDYIDLYMFHVYFPNAQYRQESWRALEDLYDQGKIRALGVSNFDVEQLKTFSSSVRIKPVVVENKLDVYHVGKQVDPKGEDIEAVCKELGIQMMSWSSLNAHPFVMMPVEDPIVKFVAAKYKWTPQQVILRWVLQRGALVIPKSTDPQHLKENLSTMNMSALSGEDFALISSISYLSSSVVHVASH